MVNKNRLLGMSALLGGMVLSSPSMAFTGGSVDVDPPVDSGGFVGLGVEVSPDYEGSDDYEAGVGLFGQYLWASGRYVEIGGTSGSEKAARLSANIISRDWSNALTFGPLVQYRLKRDGVDERQVDSLKKVDAATELGAFLGLKTGPWSAELAFAGDVSDEHDGYLVYLTGAYEWLVNDRFLVDFGLSGTYADSNYMETYFSVDSKNRGTSTLPDFNASSGIKNTELSVTGIYQFNQTWGMVGSVSWTRMLGDAEDSPLVDGRGGVGDENQFGGLVALTYSF